MSLVGGGVVRYSADAAASPGAPGGADTALPHFMLRSARFAADATVASNRMTDIIMSGCPMPALFASHFCVLWAVLCGEFAEREDAVQLCKV